MDKKTIAFPEKGFLRINQVLQFIPISRSTWWQGVKTGRFPAAIKLSPNVTVWKSSDISDLIDRF